MIYQFRGYVASNKVRGWVRRNGDWSGQCTVTTFIWNCWRKSQKMTVDRDLFQGSIPE